MNAISPRNGWNNNAIYPFLVYNGRFWVKLFGAYIWKSLQLNAVFLKLLFFAIINIEISNKALETFSSYYVLHYVVHRQVISNKKWLKITVSWSVQSYTYLAAGSWLFVHSWICYHFFILISLITWSTKYIQKNGFLKRKIRAKVKQRLWNKSGL